ncbi:MAG: tetratricopeptide repeat protein, partial [Acidobacteriota bacterium]
MIGVSAAGYPNQIQSQNLVTLSPGEIVERELSGDAVHLYQFSLPAGHYLRLSVEQKGVAIVSTIFGSGGEKLIEADYIGKESLSVIAPMNEGKPSTYRVEIRLRQRGFQTSQIGQQGQAGSYLIKIEEQRPATPRDEDRVKAGRIVAEATQLSRQTDQRPEALRRAIEQYRAALQFWRTQPVQRDDRCEESRTHYLMALRQQDLGENQAALESYLQSLEIARSEFDQPRESLALSGLGTLYFTLGDKRKAIDCYNSALRISQIHFDRATEAATLVNLGIAYKALGENSKAMEFYQLALAASRSLGDQELEAATLTNLARLYDRTGDRLNAAVFYQQALSLWRLLGDTGGEAVTLKNLGALAESTGQLMDALDYYRRALALNQMAGDLSREAHIRGDLARVERDSGNFKASRVEIEQALAFFDSQRQQLLNPELRASFASTNQRYYEFYIDLLMRQADLQSANGSSEKDNLAAAFLASEGARTRALADLIAEARIDLREGVSPALLKRERDLGQELTIRKAERVALERKKASAVEIETVVREIVRLGAVYEQTQNEIRKANPRFAALMRPAPLGLAEVQRQLLDANSVLLEYSLGEERSYVWAISHDKVRVATLPGRAVIEAPAIKFYDLLTARSQTIKFETPAQKRERIAQASRELDQVAASLSCTLLEPIAEMLGQKQLLVVADGILNYIPFGALPEPVAGNRLSVVGKSVQMNRPPATDHPQPLLVKHEIINLPSATVLAELRREGGSRQTPTKDLAIVADPVFSRFDDRLNFSQNNSPNETITNALTQPLATILDSVMRSPTERDARDLSRLPYSRREAIKIAALAPENRRLLALDFQANRSLVTDGLLSPYRYVHFATHGLLNSQSPELSGLVLSLVNDKGKSQLGVLRLGDIYKLNLSAELV